MQTFSNLGVFLGLVITLVLTTSVVGVNQYNEACTVTEGSGVSVDTCDGSKFLGCKSGRCLCQDPNQIYTYTYVKDDEARSRSKRGLGKKIAIGAGGAFVGYQLGKAASGGGPRSSNSNKKYKKVYGCYGRAGSQCVLDYNNVRIVSTSTVASTSTVTNNVSTATLPEGTNITITISSSAPTPSTSTASPLPVPAAQTSNLSSLMPKCIDHAICVPRSPSNSSHLDPRIGECVCQQGYRKNNVDECIKSSVATIQSTVLMIVGSFLLHSFL